MKFVNHLVFELKRRIIATVELSGYFCKEMSFVHTYTHAYVCTYRTDSCFLCLLNVYVC